VFVLYDAFGTHGIAAERLAAFRGRHPSGTLPALASRHVVAGAERSHVRAIVIDGVGWTGGFGIDDKWLGDRHTLHRPCHG
jgi:hypothetical protein